MTTMTDDLSFSASDFTAAPTGNAEKMADWVNKKLTRKLEKAVTVSAEIHNEDALSFTWDLGIGRKATHYAKLVCITPIEKTGEK